MILREILSGIAVRVPADIPEDSLIIYINSAIRRFGRHIGKYKLAILAADGKKTYSLPEGVIAESIKEVFVGDREVLPKSGTAKDGFYILRPDGSITFDGSIKEGEEIKIYHTSCCEAKVRSEAGDDFDNQDMGIDGEYADAVIFSAVSDYLESCEDITAANNYRLKCDEIIKNAMQGRYQKRGKYPVTKDVMK